MTQRTADQDLVDGFKALFMGDVKAGATEYGYKLLPGSHGDRVFDPIPLAAQISGAGVGVDCSNALHQALLLRGYAMPYLNTSAMYHADGQLTTVGARYFQEAVGVVVGAQSKPDGSRESAAEVVKRYEQTLVPGDVLLFPGHVAIYAGDGKLVGAQSSTGPAEARLGPYWGKPDGAKPLLGVVRPHPDAFHPEQAHKMLDRILDTRDQRIAVWNEAHPQRMVRASRPDGIEEAPAPGVAPTVGAAAPQPAPASGPSAPAQTPDHAPPAGMSVAQRVQHLTLSDREFSVYQEAVASIEAHGKYDRAAHHYGYGLESASGTKLGRYQFDLDTLRRLGYLEQGQWTGKHGADSRAEFLATPALQNLALRELTDKNASYAVAKGLDRAIGSEVGGIPITREGVLMAMHSHPKAAIQFIGSAGETVLADGLNTPISRYFKVGLEATQGRFGVSQPGGEAPEMAAQAAPVPPKSGPRPAPEARRSAPDGAQIHLDADGAGHLAFPSGVEVPFGRDAVILNPGSAQAPAIIGVPGQDGSGVVLHHHHAATGQAQGTAWQTPDGTRYRHGEEIAFGAGRYRVDVPQGLRALDTGRVIAPLTVLGGAELQLQGERYTLDARRGVVHQASGQVWPLDSYAELLDKARTHAVDAAPPGAEPAPTRSEPARPAQASLPVQANPGSEVTTSAASSGSLRVHEERLVLQRHWQKQRETAVLDRAGLLVVARGWEDGVLQQTYVVEQDGRVQGYAHDLMGRLDSRTQFEVDPHSDLAGELDLAGWMQAEAQRLALPWVPVPLAVARGPGLVEPTWSAAEARLEQGEAVDLRTAQPQAQAWWSP